MAANTAFSDSQLKNTKFTASQLENMLFVDMFLQLLKRYQKLPVGPNTPRFQTAILCLGVAILSSHWWLDETSAVESTSAGVDQSYDLFRVDSPTKRIGVMLEELEYVVDVQQLMNQIVDKQIKAGNRRLKAVSDPLDAAVCTFCAFRGVEEITKMYIPLIECVSVDILMDTSTWKITLTDEAEYWLHLNTQHIVCCTCFTHIRRADDLYMVPYVFLMSRAYLPLCKTCQNARLFGGMPQPCPALVDACCGCLKVNSRTPDSSLSPTSRKLRKYPGVARLLCDTCLKNEFLVRQIEVESIVSVSQEVAHDTSKQIEENAYVFIKRLLADQMTGSYASEAALADSVLERWFGKPHPK